MPQFLSFQSIAKSVLVFSVCLSISGCVGAIVGAAVDTTIEVAKVPFKVAGAVVDVATPDRHKSDKREPEKESRKKMRGDD